MTHGTKLLQPLDFQACMDTCLGQAYQKPGLIQTGH